MANGIFRACVAQTRTGDERAVPLGVQYVFLPGFLSFFCAAALVEYMGRLRACGPRHGWQQGAL